MATTIHMTSIALRRCSMTAASLMKDVLNMVDQLRVDSIRVEWQRFMAGESEYEGEGRFGGELLMWPSNDSRSWRESEGCEKVMVQRMRRSSKPRMPMTSGSRVHIALDSVMVPSSKPRSCLRRFRV